MKRTLSILPAAGLFFFTYTLLPGQENFSWRLSGESGIYQDKVLQRNDLFLRLDGQARFKYRLDNFTASIQTRAIPSFYNSKPDIRSLKLIVYGLVEYTKPSYDISLEGNNRTYHFQNSVDDIRGDLRLIQVSLNKLFNRSIVLGGVAGAGEENIATNNHYTRELWFTELRTVFHLLKSLKMNSGFYYEDFLLHRDEMYIFKTLSNRGQRFGPLLQLSLLTNIWIRLEYRYLIHNSDLVTSNSFENNFRFFIGKTIERHLTFLLLADYNARRFNVAQKVIPDINLIYSPLEMENRIYLKTVFSVNEKWDLYLRLGYGQESFQQRYFIIEGWQTVAGISIK